MRIVRGTASGRDAIGGLRGNALARGRAHPAGRGHRPEGCRWATGLWRHPRGPIGGGGDPRHPCARIGGDVLSFRADGAAAGQRADRSVVRRAGAAGLPLAGPHHHVPCAGRRRITGRDSPGDGRGRRILRRGEGVRLLARRSDGQVFGTSRRGIRALHPPLRLALPRRRGRGCVLRRLGAARPHVRPRCGRYLSCGRTAALAAWRGAADPRCRMQAELRRGLVGVLRTPARRWRSAVSSRSAMGRPELRLRGYRQLPAAVRLARRGGSSRPGGGGGSP